MILNHMYLPNSDRPFSIFQKVPETRNNFPKDWEYYDIDQMNAPDLYQGRLFSVSFCEPFFVMMSTM